MLRRGAKVKRGAGIMGWGRCGEMVWVRPHVAVSRGDAKRFLLWDSAALMRPPIGRSVAARRRFVAWLQVVFGVLLQNKKEPMLGLNSANVFLERMLLQWVWA